MGPLEFPLGRPSPSPVRLRPQQGSLRLRVVSRVIPPRVKGPSMGLLRQLGPRIVRKRHGAFPNAPCVRRRRARGSPCCRRRRSASSGGKARPPPRRRPKPWSLERRRP
ncbi:hypothetical protein M885DRAFT_139723 [Pelagophyceae sp. CCMP2097]|nr:hypothetical protein M885DRAFT_139723 [Pelagophyceae sp. CCMP2097]